MQNMDIVEVFYDNICDHVLMSHSTHCNLFGSNICIRCEANDIERLPYRTEDLKDLCVQKLSGLIAWLDDACPPLAFPFLSLIFTLMHGAQDWKEFTSIKPRITFVLSLSFLPPQPCPAVCDQL